MLILCIWDKLYYISLGKGNNPDSYFVTINEECPIHKSNICKCMNSKNDLYLVEQYINLYKYSKKIFIFENGKIVYLNSRSKNQFKFSI